MEKDEFKEQFVQLTNFADNPFHPLLWINGEPEIGVGNQIGGMSAINASGARMVIGNYCDIASFVDINVGDTHRMVIGLAEQSNCQDIIIGDHIFIGSHCFIMGGTRIGDRSVIGAGTILRGETVPPYSLVVGNPAVIKPGYYEKELLERGIISGPAQN
jgi:acetyltransferase-like isoleucine patch superfamily enzyme